MPKVSRKGKKKGKKLKPDRWTIIQHFEIDQGFKLCEYIGSKGTTGVSKNEIKKYLKGLRAKGKPQKRRINSVLKDFEAANLIFYDEKNEVYKLTLKGKEYSDKIKKYFEELDDVDEIASFSTPSKKAALNFYLNFAKENLEVEPSRCKVLCLTGPSWTERFVYEELGIPETPDNIVTVEKEEKTQKKIKQNVANGKWNVRFTEKECEDVKKYVKETDEKFHIIHLDYDGYIKKEDWETLETIFERELLEDGGILAITSRKGREQGEHKICKREKAMPVYLTNAIFGDGKKVGEFVDLWMRKDENGKDKDDVPRKEVPFAIGMLDYMLKRRMLEQKFGNFLRCAQQDKKFVSETLKNVRIPKNIPKAVYYKSKSAMQIFLYKFVKGGKEHPIDYEEWKEKYVSNELDYVNLGSVKSDDYVDKHTTVVIDKVKGKRKVTEHEKNKIREYVKQRKDEGASNTAIREELMGTYELNQHQALAYAVSFWKGKKKSK